MLFLLEQFRDQAAHAAVVRMTGDSIGAEAEDDIRPSGLKDIVKTYLQLGLLRAEDLLIHEVKDSRRLDPQNLAGTSKLLSTDLGQFRRIGDAGVRAKSLLSGRGAYEVNGYTPGGVVSEDGSQSHIVVGVCRNGE